MKDYVYIDKKIEQIRREERSESTIRIVETIVLGVICGVVFLLLNLL